MPSPPHHRSRLCPILLLAACVALVLLALVWTRRPPPSPPTPAPEPVADLAQSPPPIANADEPDAPPQGDDLLLELSSASDPDLAPYLGPGLAEEWIEFERLPGSLLFPRLPMTMEAAIWRAYQMLSTNPAVDPAALGSKMLSSTNAWVRTTGAIWILEKNRTLPPEILDRLLADEQAFVPLTVLGWMIDSGLPAEAESFETRWKNAPDDAWQAAVHALAEEPLNGTAGRAALWLANRSPWTDDEKRDWMAGVAGNDETAYDIRWKAALLLRSRLPPAEYRQQVLAWLNPGALPSPLPPPDGIPPEAGQDPSPFTLAITMLNSRIAGPETLAAHPVLAADDPDLLFAQESSLMLENIALWVEAATESDALHIEPGFTQSLARHLDELPLDELPANQRLALRRIQSRLPALAQREHN